MVIIGNVWARRVHLPPVPCKPKRPGCWCCGLWWGSDGDGRSGMILDITCATPDFARGAARRGRLGPECAWSHLRARETLFLPPARARTACSPGDTSRPASATPTARSTASTSPSTRRSTARSSSSSPPPASSPSAKTRSCSGRPVRARAISPRPSAAPRSSRAIASSTARRTPSSKSSPRRRSPRPARTIWPS